MCLVDQLVVVWFFFSSSFETGSFCVALDVLGLTTHSMDQVGLPASYLPECWD